MIVEDRSEPFACIAIRGKNDKVRSTILAVHEPIDVSQSSKMRCPNKYMHIPEWSKEMTRYTVDHSSSAVFHSRVLLLKSSLHDMISATHADSSSFDHYRDISRDSWEILIGYWEWTEDVLCHNQGILDRAKIYAAVRASLFMYIYDKNILQALFELWCPLTNTLHTAIGELSISLWDLRGLCKLSIRGDFYDDVIPSGKELLDVDANPSSLPRSYKYLFLAYHRLPKDSCGVLIFDWINFWFKGAIRYAEPPLRSSQRKYSKRELPPHPSGNIDDSILPHPKEYNEPFIVLGVEVNCFFLAVPVLANIYRGLREILNSTNLSESNVVFPIHYVYGWMGQYFQTHFLSKFKIVSAQMEFKLLQACSIFRHANPSKLQNLHNQGELLVKNHMSISDTYKDLFITLRSSYLTFWSEGMHIVETYSPHRFSHIPSCLKKEILTCELSEQVQLWQSCMFLGTSSKITLPDCGSPLRSPLTSKNSSKGDRGASSFHGSKTEKRRNPFAGSTLKQASVVIPNEGNEVISILLVSNDTSSNQDQLKKRQKVFDLEHITVDSFFFEDVPSSLMPEFSNTSTGNVGSVNGASPFDMPEADITSDSPTAAAKKLFVEEIVLKKNNKTFESPRRQPLSPEALEFCPRVVRTEAEKQGALKAQPDELKEQIAELTDKEELANSVLLKAHKNLSNIQESVTTKRENVSKLDDTLYVSKKETNTLKRMEELLEESQQDLVVFDLFP
ncbi:hypothetical protein CDL12_16458 [Handroanthus impetiginosus]|uniref:Aminotransferase-like plant mobile domain-containing protein n=1 Tax=Handroanthus impetiginosus TaxID=429701 RepID=A0A2G9H092_9LAMI|nr:hypothetical protein CDL12_16458 [Handroanthus impetiginosus]